MGLEARGHTVRIVSALSEAHLRADRRYEIAQSESAHPARRLFRMAGVVARLGQISRDCDVIHLNLPTPAFAALADMTALTSRKPLILGFEAHLADVPSALGRLRAAPEFYAPRIVINNGLLGRVHFGKPASVVVSSDYQRRELQRLGYGAGDVEVIPNLFDHSKLRPTMRSAARSSLGLPDDAPLVVFAGHYHDVKGHDVLIEAFRGIGDRVPNARLVLAWSGIGSQARVRRQIELIGLEDRVIELGRVSIGALFAAANVVALPYRMTIGQAAFPGTVLEAMAVGAPLVTTRHPLLVELVRDGDTGLLARPGSAADLEEQVVRLLGDPSLQERMVGAQRRFIAERFDPARVLTQYENVYERAIAGQTRVLQTA